jgi:hypothetical protein
VRVTHITGSILEAWSSFRRYPCTSLSGRKNTLSGGLRNQSHPFLLLRCTCKEYWTPLCSKVASMSPVALLLLFTTCLVSCPPSIGSASYSFRSHSDLRKHVHVSPMVGYPFFSSIKYNGWMSFWQWNHESNCKIWRYRSIKPWSPLLRHQKDKRKIETTTDALAY